MSNSIRQCVKALDKNKDVRQMLPDYVDKCMHMNYEDAKLKLMMHYYVYYEMVTEGINPYIESARDTTDAVNEIIADIYERGLTNPALRGGNKNRSTDIWKNSREYADKVQGTYNITAFFMKRSFLCSILYSVDRSKREMLRRIDWRNPDEL